MPNIIRNASFLDGTDGWGNSSGGGGFVLSTDETTRGSPGRQVGILSGATAANPQNVSFTTTIAAAGPVTAGTVVEAFTHWFGRPGTFLAVYFLNDANGVVSAPQLSILRTPLTGQRGIMSTFGFAYGQFTVPTGATKAQLRQVVALTGLGTAETQILLKPFIGPARANGRRNNWQPGPHANADLNLVSWPTDLPMPRPDSFSASPTPVRRGFEADAGVPITTRMAGEPWNMVDMEFQLTLEERDRLDQFWFASQGGPFWFNRPDTQQLCRARWAEEGDPRDQGMGPARVTGLSLLLEPA